MVVGTSDDIRKSAESAPRDLRLGWGSAMVADSGVPLAGSGVPTCSSALDLTPSGRLRTHQWPPAGGIRLPPAVGLRVERPAGATCLVSA